MNVKDLLIGILEEGFPLYPVFLDGTIDEEEEYPNSFITVWTSFTDDVAHYDDETTAVAWRFNVKFYTTNAALIATVPQEIITLLKAAHFIPQGKGNDIPSDVITHTGWVIEFLYKENLQKEG